MVYLLVKEKGKRKYSLYCPDTYGSHSWGSTSQYSLIKKRKLWYVQYWSASNEMLFWTEEESKLNVVKETSDLDEIILYLAKNNKNEIEHIIKDARKIYNEYLDLCEHFNKNY